MAKSVYLDRGIQPDERMLAGSLGKCTKYWDKIICHSAETYPALSNEWKHYGKAWGWSLVLKSKSKTLCYMIPMQGFFYVAVIFSDKGRMAVASTALPDQVRQAVEAAKDNPKNIPYDFKVTLLEDVEIAKKLIDVRFKT